jgi:hypothetical protein
MALGVPPDVREVVTRVCVRPDVLDACRRRDLGTVIEILGAHGVTQGKIAGLTGIGQGRLTEYMTHKRTPCASSTFLTFADGLGMPPAARDALGLAPDRSRVDSISGQLPDTLAELGLVYPDTPTEAAGNLTWLWRSDLNEMTVLRDEIKPQAWSDASLRWLLGPSHQLPSESASGVHIGLADVARFRATVDMFVQLDNRFGGRHARTALIQYLSADAERLLHGRYTGAVGQALFSATAEATLLAAWMSYDSMPGSALAQRYFIQALALAQAGNDRLLGASVLDAMSHQATYTGRFGEAANLARAAATGTRGVSTATLASHFHAMEARALARLGDAKVLQRFEQEVDPDGTLSSDERRLRAEHAKRAYMLRLSKRAVAARKST